MVKYNFELKMNIVQKYLDGQDGYAYLGKKHGVKHQKTDRKLG